MGKLRRMYNGKGTYEITTAEEIDYLWTSPVGRIGYDIKEAFGNLRSFCQGFKKGFIGTDKPEKEKI